MSKHVDFKYGLTLSYDNSWCVASDEPHRQDYRAVVVARRYVFKQINSLNVQIETPAQQLIWQKIGHRHYVLTSFAEKWLQDNVGEKEVAWDVNDKVDRSGDTIFFKTEKDARRFVRRFESLLRGMSYA